MNYKIIGTLLAALLGGLFVVDAHAQSYTGQIPSGAVYGNATAGAAKPSGSTVNSILDRNYGTTNSTVLYRSGGVWSESTNPTLLYGIFTGTGVPAQAAGQTFIGGTVAAPSGTANGQAWFYNQTANGAVIQGQGSAEDFLLLNKSGGTVCVTPTGTVTFTCNILAATTDITAPYGLFNGTSSPASAAGQTVTAGTIAAPSLANNGQSWLYNTTAGGAILQGQGSSTDVAFANKGGTVVCSISTGTTTLGCTTLNLTNPLTVVNGGTGGGTASGTLLDNITAFSSTGYINRTGAGTYVFNPAATTAQYEAGTASKVVEAGTIYTAEVTVTFGATTTFDFSTFINAAVTLTGNITTMTLSNITAGKAGTITFIQDGTGSRTTVWNSNFKFANGVTPTLSTAPNAVDVLSYSCRSATFCVAALSLNVK